MWARFFAACPGIRRVDACQDAAAEPIDVPTGRASVQFRSFAAEWNRRLPKLLAHLLRGAETSAVWVEGDEVMAMFVWILILGSWVAVLSLILHDATKDDNDGSAIAIAAKKIKAFTFWAILKARTLGGTLSYFMLKVRRLRGTLSYLMLKARRLRETFSYRTSQTSGSKPPVRDVTAVSAISSSSQEIRQGGPSVDKQAPALPPKNAKKIQAFTLFATLKARNLRRKLSYRTLQRSASKPPKVTAVSASSSSEVIRQRGPSLNKKAPALPPKKKWWRKDRRVSMTTSELELAISEAVKKAAPGCEDFVGVIVQHKTPKSHLDPNWAIRGAKFGKADRKVADEALATVVERMRREFLLSED